MDRLIDHIAPPSRRGEARRNVGSLNNQIRVAAVLIVVACAKHQDKAPPSPLQDGSSVVASLDAPVVAIDAPVIRESATAVKVVVGATSACALLSDATVRCWGANGSGQLGDGSTLASQTPVKPNVRGVEGLVLGDDFACGLLDDSSVACWGKIGFGKGRKALAPAAAPGVHDIVKLFAIGGAACGSDKAGALVCWGDVDARGHVSTAGASHAPTPVPGLSHVVALTAHAALLEDHSFLTWTDGGAPTPSGLGTATELAERGVPCALTAKGEVDCIADHPACGPTIVLGDKPAALVEKKKPVRKSAKPARSAKPVKPMKPEPVAKVGAFALPFAKPRHLAFDTGVCVQTVQDRLECVDPANKCVVTRPWPAFVTIDQLSGGCARLANGTVRCGAAGSEAAPLIDGVTNAIAISVTSSRGCALTKEHAVLCWDGVDAAKPVRFSAPD